MGGILYKAFLKEKPNQAINDQPFFRVAAHKGDIRIATLTREYNCKYRGQGYLNGPVKIIHGHIDLRLDTAHIQGALKVLNASHRPRVYVAGRVYEQQIVGRLIGRRKAHKLGSFPELPILLRRLVRLKSAVKEMGLGAWVESPLVVPAECAADRRQMIPQLLRPERQRITRVVS
jgi:hypothetical protein